MSERTPTIAGMLQIGLEVGLLTVDDAWLEYIRHCDVFFDLSNFHEQRKNLWEDIQEQNLMGLTIVEAMAQMGLKLPADAQDQKGESRG